MSPLTRYLHFTAGYATGCMNTAGCTTGWVNYANDPAKRRLSGPARTLMTSAVWTVDDVAHLIELKKFLLFIYFYHR